MEQVVKFDRYVIDTLLPDLVGHDRRPAAFLVYLALWARATDNRARTVSISLRDLAEATGLSKRAVQGAVGRLAKRRLIDVARISATAVPEYTVLRPWKRRAA
ncbi:MAG: helix-turn-helix domain-containing protein [Gemmatimonadaceae bacterium]